MVACDLLILRFDIGYYSNLLLFLLASVFIFCKTLARIGTTSDEWYLGDEKSLILSYIESGQLFDILQFRLH